MHQHVSFGIGSHSGERACGEIGVRNWYPRLPYQFVNWEAACGVAPDQEYRLVPVRINQGMPG